MNKRLSYPEDFTLSIARQYQGHTGRYDDGTRWFSYHDVIWATLSDGRDFFLPNGMVEMIDHDDSPYETVTGEYCPETRIHEVVEKGINLDKWIFVPVTPTLSEILEAEVERERGYF